jgi:hypothetical protein
LYVTTTFPLACNSTTFGPALYRTSNAHITLSKPTHSLFEEKEEEDGEDCVGSNIGRCVVMFIYKHYNK